MRGRRQQQATQPITPACTAVTASAGAWWPRVSRLVWQTVMARSDTHTTQLRVWIAWWRAGLRWRQLALSARA